MPKPDDSPYLTVAEAAEFLRLKRRTLDNMRYQGIGPKYRKHGGRIVYHVEDLETWSRNTIRQSTSDPGGEVPGDE